MAKKVVARCKLRWDGDGPFGTLDTEEIGGPCGVRGRVVRELLDLDPDLLELAKYFLVEYWGCLRCRYRP